MPSQVGPVGVSVPRQIAETSEWTLKLLPAQPTARRTLDNANPQHKLVWNYHMRPQEGGYSSEHEPRLGMHVKVNLTECLHMCSEA